MEEKDKSAIDIIYKLEKDLDELKKSVALIDANIKLLLKAKNESIQAERQNNSPSASAIIIKKQEEPVLNTNAVNRQYDIRDDGMVKVFGKIKNKELKPVPNIVVKIFDANNALVKKRNSNDSGMWETRLPPGKYNVEYDFSLISNKLRPMIINIEVKEGMPIYEVK